MCDPCEIDVCVVEEGDVRPLKFDCKMIGVLCNLVSRSRHGSVDQVAKSPIRPLVLVHEFRLSRYRTASKNTKHAGLSDELVNFFVCCVCVQDCQCAPA